MIHHGGLPSFSIRGEGGDIRCTSGDVIDPFVVLEDVARGVGEDDNRSRCLDPPRPPGDALFLLRLDKPVVCEGDIGGRLVEL